MLSFREQVEDLKTMAAIQSGEEQKRNIKAIANEILQDALKQLQKSRPFIIRDIQGIEVRIIQHSYTSICINYFDELTPFSFTLVHRDLYYPERALQVSDAIMDILIADKLRITKLHKYSFKAFL